jgi:hypothetical protein
MTSFSTVTGTSISTLTGFSCMCVRDLSKGQFLAHTTQLGNSCGHASWMCAQEHVCSLYHYSIDRNFNDAINWYFSHHFLHNFCSHNAINIDLLHLVDWHLLHHLQSLHHSLSCCFAALEHSIALNICLSVDLLVPHFPYLSIVQ